MNNFFAKNKKWILIAAIALVVIAAAVVAIVLVTSNGDSDRDRSDGKVDLVDYIEITEEGFNGYGSLNISFDYLAAAEKLKLDTIEDIRELKNFQDENHYSTAYILSTLDHLGEDLELNVEELEDLVNSFDITLSQSDDLRNGDIVTITVDIYRDTACGKKVKGGELRHRMTDLREVESYFPAFECSFSGYNGSGSIDCRITDESLYWFDYISFTCDNNGNLSNGDVITVTATISDDIYSAAYNSMLSEGYEIPNSATATFTVSGLGQMLTLDLCTDAVLDAAAQIVKDDTVLADPTLVPRVSMMYLMEGDEGTFIVVALEFPEPGQNWCWNHIRYLSNVSLAADGSVLYDQIGEVLSGSCFDAASQEEYILNCNAYYGCTVTKLR